MKLESHRLNWDYTGMADAYVSRPPYSSAAIQWLIQRLDLAPGDPVLELGAGVAHLTLQLAPCLAEIQAIEPNPGMRAGGQRRTAHLPNVHWHDALMQCTGMAAESFKVAAYGSSFGVADHQETLREAQRVLRPDGVMACLFNYRNLNDPLQQAIEGLIQRELPNFDRGPRRQNQTPFINESGLFGPVHHFEETFLHQQDTESWLEAWSAHATLERQAGNRFPHLLDRIAALVNARCGSTLTIPYTTHVWIALRAP